MQTVSSNFLAAVKGSNTPIFYADLWRDSVLVTSLNVVDGSVRYDSTSNVQGTASLTVMDVDGTLTPTSMGSTFTPFGAQINIRAGFKIGQTVETVSLGWFVIWDMTIDETWKEYSTGVVSKLVRKGTKIELSLKDLTQQIADYKFLSPTVPKKANAWLEIASLCSGIVSTQDPGYTPITIPKKLTYGEDRFEAIKALAAVHAAEPVLLPNGKLTLKLANETKTSANTAPAFGWNVNLTDFKKSLSRDGVYNVVVARGKDANGNNLVQYATLNDGPTRWNGPFGTRPVFYDTELINTSSALLAFATSKLNSLATQNTQNIPVTALPNPAIQLGDYADLTIQGSTNAITCRVVGFTYNAKGLMTVDLSMPTNWIG